MRHTGHCRGRRAGARTQVQRAALLATLAAGTFSAQAFQFDLDDDWKGSWNTTLSLGAGWRMQNRDPGLIGPNNAAEVPGANGGDANSDDGDLNYGKGKAFTKLVKGVSEVELKYRKDFGGFVRGAALYDQALKHDGVPHGNTVNGYAAGQPLGDDGFYRMNKFSTAYLLDAYVYGNVDLAGAKVNSRLGKQVVSWGESLFIPGVNAMVPVSVPALRRPGTELKEAFLPTNQLFASVGLPDGPTVEGFYQLGWQRTLIDGCGTYFSNADFLFDPSCGPVNVSNAPPLSDHDALAAGGVNLQQRLPDVAARKGGQWGLALRQRVDALDVDLGAYYSTYTSRTPIVSKRVLAAMVMTPNGPVIPGAVQVEYPDRIRLMGLSASTAFGAWQVGAEYSYSPNFPVGYNAMDVAMSGSLLGPLAGQAAATPVGGLLSAYERVKKHQLQANFTRIFNNIAGANYMAFVGEAAYQSVDGLSPAARFGRSSSFGFSTAGQVFPVPVLAACPGPLNANAANCGSDGFVTSTSWGYRLLTSLSYGGLLPGFTFTPRVAWNHDVRGNSADGQTFIENRRSVSAGLQTVYLNDYAFDISYTRFITSKFDPLRDRDYLTVSASVSF